MDSVRRQTISDQSTWLAQASAVEGFDEPWPSLEGAQDDFDERLNAEGDSEMVAPVDRERRRAMGLT